MKAAISARGIRKAYGAVVAVDGLDLEIPKGALFGLLGPNGAGKSTTFGILCGWLRGHTGAAEILGVPSNRLHRLGGKVSALPQDAAFPPQIAVGDELAHFGRLGGLSARAARKEAERLLELVGLRDLATATGRELSHGMLKRVGLAQALLGSPEVVFLDEPTAGLDPKVSRDVKDLIQGLIPRATVMLSSHNLAEVQEICTHGAILDHGRLVKSGSIDQLTHRATQVTIEIVPDSIVPLEALEQAFGKSNVERTSPDCLTLYPQAEQEVADFIAQALRLLLDGKTQILGVRRGTTLEEAFLRVTGAKDFPSQQQQQQ